MGRQGEQPLILSGAAPKWLQVTSALKTRIQQLIDRDELRLPTENELAAEYGVSVITVRQALANLETHGWVERRRRAGTFIRKEALAEPQILYLGDLHQIVEQQHSEWTEVVSTEIVSVPDHLRALFPGQQNVSKLVRRRFVSGDVRDYTINYLRLDVAASFDLKLLEANSMTKIILDHTVFEIGAVEQDLVADIADPDISQILDIPSLSPIMKLTGRTFDRSEQILDLALITYRGDRVKFRLRASSS